MELNELMVFNKLTRLQQIFLISLNVHECLSCLFGLFHFFFFFGKLLVRNHSVTYSFQTDHAIVYVSVLIDLEKQIYVKMILEDFCPALLEFAYRLYSLLFWNFQSLRSIL